jgi:hypothetical protein
MHESSTEGANIAAAERIVSFMARCTAPVNGHRSRAAAAACPACGGRYRSYGSYSYPSYSPSRGTGGGQSSSGSGSSGGGSRSVRPHWSPAGSLVIYTPTEVQTLTPIRESVESLAEKQPDLRDVFLCHAWDDRQGPAKELHDLLVSHGVKVWFSEKDILLGVPMMRAIDKGLANSRVGIVLVTPALLKRIPNESIADKELSALLARHRLIPIIHNTTFEALSDVSPMLASRGGLNTKDETMAEVAAKLAETVKL